MLNLLNFIAWNLQSRIFFEISLFFSLFYFVLALGQVIHIIWNHYHPSQDWGTKKNHRPWTYHTWKGIKASSLFKEIIVSGIIIILLVLIFPVLHV